MHNRMQTTRGFISLGLILLLVIGLAVLGGTGYYAMQQNATSQTSSPATSAAQSQLAVDLSNITPQFVEYKSGPDGKQILSPDLEKIRNDVGVILIGPGPYDSSTGADVVLMAIGKRYVVATVTRPTGAGVRPQIIDSNTLKPDYLPGPFQLKTDKIAVFVSAKDICMYRLDEPSCVPLPGAKLSGKEVYGDDETMPPFVAPRDAKLTDTSLTIAVLAWTNPGTDLAKLQKVRNITLALPPFSR